MSTTCTYCGGEIIFRYIDGQLVPIHLSGSCSGYSGSRYSDSSYTRFTYDHDPADMCRSTICSSCGEAVFFIRHNGGCVWVDELGWPWPKHACYYDDDDQLHQHLHGAASQGDTAILGVIYQVEARPRGVEDRCVVLYADGKAIYVSIAGLEQAEKLVGDLIVLNITNNHIILPGKRTYRSVSITRGQSEATGTGKQYHQYTLGGNMLSCPDCGGLIPKQYMTHHRRQEHNMMVCPLCKDSIDTTAFQSHMYAEHSKTMCPHCHTFVNTNFFEKHLWIVHTIRDPAASMLHADTQTHRGKHSRKKSVSKQKKKEDGVQTCEFCHAVFPGKKSLQKHISQRHATIVHYRQSIATQKPESDNQGNNAESSPKKPSAKRKKKRGGSQACPFCAAVLPDTASLHEHISQRHPHAAKTLNR